MCLKCRTHAQNQLNGITKTKFKKIDNLEDAELFYDDHCAKWFSHVKTQNQVIIIPTIIQSSR
jgi:viroplasmin and RNaseH domain-containing protein